MTRWGWKARRGPVPVSVCWRLKRSLRPRSNYAMCAGVWRWKMLKSVAMRFMPGVTTGPALENAAVRLDDGRCDGAQSA